MTGLIAVIELGFDPLIQLGSLTLRWQTIGVTVALLLALAVAALLIPRAEEPPTPKPQPAPTSQFPDAPEIFPSAKRPLRGAQASAAVPSPTLEQLLLMLVGIVPGAVVGGRIVHVVEFAGAYAANPATIVDPRVGSLSLLGAVLGGTLSALYVCRLLRAPVDGWARIAAGPLLLVLGLGKLAQLLGGAGQGVPFGGPWATAFVGDGPWVSFAPSVPSHPSQVYEGVWLLLGIGAVLVAGGARRVSQRVHPYVAWADRERSGTWLFIGAVGWFLAGRLLIGFTWRDPQAAGPLNVEQLIALVLLGVGVSYVWLRRGLLVRTMAVVLTAVLLAGCGSTTAPVVTGSPMSATAAPTMTSAASSPDSSLPASQKPRPTTVPSSAPTGSVGELLAGMTTDEKIGQLFMVEFYGDTADETNAAQVKANRRIIGADNIAAAIARYHLGGVIYFSWAGNLASAAQIATLSNAIQATGTAQRAGVPLLISTDQEGGAIARLPAPATAFAGNMALGATRSADLARATGRAIGEELRAVGINDALAPVADVNVNPANPIIGLRSFGADPSAVAALTTAMVSGFQDGARVGATVKHFPGHGDTDIDSHSQLPLITHTAAQWNSVDAPPFAAAVGSGVDSVMVGHLAFPALDGTGTPASLSRPIVHDVLRGQLGFNGVVITDSLGMGALRDTYGDDRIPVLALAAGDDILLMPPSLDVAYRAVQAAVASGEISAARLDAAVTRILTLKQKLGLFGAPPVNVQQAAAGWGTRAHRAAATNLADASVTLVSNDNRLLPLAAPTSATTFLVVGPTPTSVARLAAFLRARGASASTYVTGRAPRASVAQSAVTRAQSATMVVALTDDADADPGQQRVVDALNQTGKPLITVATGRPYDEGYYGAAVNVCLYSDSAASLRSLVSVMYGEHAPAGHLPVAIEDPSRPGTVLYALGYGLTYTSAR